MKWLIPLLLLAASLPAQAQTSPPVIQQWHVTTTNSTIAWETPHTGPEYTHVIYALATHKRDNEAAKIKLMEVPGSQLEATVTYPGNVPEGLYYHGFQTVFHPNDVDYPDVVQESEIVWSSDPTVVQGGITFGAFFAPVLERSSGLKLISHPAEP